MTDSPDRELALRDEVLEFLYWLEGEGIGGNATLDGIERFLTCERTGLVRALEALVGRGDVTLDPTTGEYRLTPVGRPEAGRRFAEEFGPLLGQGHGECSDPECDCHTSPEGAVECRAGRAHLH